MVSAATSPVLNVYFRLAASEGAAAGRGHVTTRPPLPLRPRPHRNRGVGRQLWLEDWSKWEEFEHLRGPCKPAFAHLVPPSPVVLQMQMEFKSPLFDLKDSCPSPSLPDSSFIAGDEGQISPYPLTSCLQTYPAFGFFAVVPERHELFSQDTPGSLLRQTMLESLLGTLIGSLIMTVLVPE